MSMSMSMTGGGDQFYDDIDEDAYVHEDGDDMEVVDDIMEGDEPPMDNENDDDDENEDGNADVERQNQTVRLQQDGDDDIKDASMDDGCESGEPEIVPLREDAVDVMMLHRAPVFKITSVQGSHSSSASFATGSGDDTAIIWRQSKRYESWDLACTSGDDTCNNSNNNNNNNNNSGSRWEGQILKGQHTDTIASLEWSSDGTKLATGGLDGRVVLWDAESGNHIRTLDGAGGAIEWLCWHPRGPVIMAGSEDFTTWMWNADTGTCMQVFSGHRAEVNCGLFTPDGKAVVTASMDNSLRVWSPRDGTATAVIEGYPFHTRAITSLDCHCDSIVMLTGDEVGQVCISSAVSGKVLSTLGSDNVKHSDTVESVAFSKSFHSLFASASLDGKVILWDINSQTHRACLNHSDGVTAIAWHPSIPLIASAGLDSIIRVWDARTASCVREFHGHKKSIHDIKFCEHGVGFEVGLSASLLLSCSEDRSARAFAFHDNTIL